MMQVDETEEIEMGGVAAVGRPVVVASGINGRIAYLGADGREIGRERFEILHHAGGHVLRALCEIDDEALLRDVTLSMDSRWRPLDGFCRIIKHGRPLAAMWFDIGAESVRVASCIGQQSSDELHVLTDGRLPYLGLHPLQGDALIAAIRGTDDPGRYVGIDAVTNSVSPNGDEACRAVPVRIDVAYIGEETISVIAGRFDALRYAVRWREDWPAADLCVRGGDHLFLRMQWALVPTTYELTAFQEMSS